MIILLLTHSYILALCLYFCLCFYALGPFFFLAFMTYHYVCVKYVLGFFLWSDLIYAYDHLCLYMVYLLEIAYVFLDSF